MNMQEEHVFIENKKQGDEFESHALEEIQKKVNVNAFIDDRGKAFDEWDIYVTENLTFECKNDLEAGNTPNICVEAGQDGKPSGIKQTKSKYWLHSGDTKTYLARTSDIKRLINAYDAFIIGYNKIVETFDNNEEIDDNIKKYLIKAHSIFGEELYNDIFPLKIQFRNGQKIPQSNGVNKYMDLYLIPKEIFAHYCMEIEDKGKLTFKDVK